MPKLNPVRVPARRRDPAERIKDLEEVELGYSVEEAIEEAKRCILCPKPHCVEGCPAHNRIPQFIKAIQEGQFEQAAKEIFENSVMPAVCSRVCDHARQCEGVCVVKKRGDAIAIGMLERFAADWYLRHAAESASHKPTATAVSGKVAVIGAGPAGVAAAYRLAMLGHKVTVFEARNMLGGVLSWGIPSFRLPQWVIDGEMRRLVKAGVEIKYGVRVGRDMTVDELFAKGYQAVFIGIGTEKSKPMGIPGEDLKGVYPSTLFLTKAKLSAMLGASNVPPPEIGRNVAVIGAGNTAMDAAQTALRMGAGTVTIVYRRSEAEAPARHEELDSSREEGVNLKFLTTPSKFIGNGNGHVVAMECVQMQLGEPDSSGRRRPLPVPGSEFKIDVDTVVLALGFDADKTLGEKSWGLQLSKDGLITVNEQTGATARPGVWAGGDAVSGADVVVRAMAHGIRAAKSIHEYLSSKAGQPSTNVAEKV